MNTIPRYYTTTSTRQALIEESKARIAENNLKREYARLVLATPNLVVNKTDVPFAIKPEEK